MSKSKINLDDLINEGSQYSFDNNKKYSYDQYYSHATPDLLAWVSKVEDYIRTNFDENSGPLKMLDSVKKQKFSGSYQSEFETELVKLKGAIKSCKNLKPNKKTSDTIIISLIKNPLFWTILTVVIGAAYKLGYDNGVAKYDNEKNELSKQNAAYKDSITLLNKKIVIQETLLKSPTKK